MIGVLFWLFVASVVYTYAGYPLLLWALARFKRQPGPFEPATPPVTLLIAAFNEERVIAQKIENSLALDYPRNQLQILVADDGSDDNTRHIIQRYAAQGVELSYNPPRRGKIGAINRAMAQARGKIVVFSDATNIYQPNVLRELIAPFADPTVGAVTGARSIVAGDGALGESEGLYWKYESFIQQQETRLGSCTAAAGDILAVRRTLFEPPPDNVVIDDFYMIMRLIKRGYRIYHAPDARTSERVSLTAQHEVERRARMIAGRYQAISMAGSLLPFNRPLIVWQVVSHKFMRPLVPLAMIGALIMNGWAVAFPPAAGGSALLRLAPPFNWVMLGLQALFYVLAGVGNLVERRSGIGRALYLPAFLVNSNFAALIGLFRFLTKGQSTLWSRAPRRNDLQGAAQGGPAQSDDKS